MGGEKCERQVERFIRRTSTQEFEGIVLIFLSDMDFRPVRLLDPMFAVVRAGEVEFLRRKSAVMSFADVADVIAVGFQQAQIALFPWSFKGFESSVAMARHPLACEERSTTHSADRGRHARPCEAESIAGEFIELWCFNDRVSGATQRIVTPVICVKHKDVHRLFRSENAGKQQRTKRD